MSFRVRVRVKMCFRVGVRVRVRVRVRTISQACNLVPIIPPCHYPRIFFSVVAKPPVRLAIVIDYDRRPVSQASLEHDGGLRHVLGHGFWDSVALVSWDSGDLKDPGLCGSVPGPRALAPWGAGLLEFWGSGVPKKRAQDAFLNTTLQVELAQLSSQLVARGSVDVYKYSDQVNREFVYLLAS